MALRMLLPRFLGAEELGILTYAESWSGLILGFSQLGVGVWLMKNVAVHPEKAGESTASALLMTGGLGALLWLVVIIIPALRGKSPSELLVVGIMGVYMLMFIIQRAVFRRVCVALNETRRVSKLEVYQRMLTLACVAVALVVWPKSAGAAIAQLIGQLFIFILLWKYLVNVNALKANATVAKSFDIARQSLPFFMASVLVDVTGNINAPLLDYFASPAEVGLLGAALRIQGAFLIFIPVIDTSVQPTLARLYATDRERYGLYVRNLLRTVLAFSILIGLAMATFGDVAVKVINGDGFSDAVRTLILLGPATILTFLASYLGSAAMMNNKGYAMAIQTALVLVTNVVLAFLILPEAAARGPGLGAGAVAVITGIGELLIVIGFGFILGRKIVPPSTIVHAVLAFFACGVAAWYADALNQINIVLRIMFLATAYVAYVLATGLVKKSDLTFIQEILSRRANRSANRQI